MSVMSAKTLTLEDIDNVELQQEVKKKRKEMKMLNKMTLIRTQTMRKWRRGSSTSLNSSFVLNVPQTFWKEPTMEILFAKNIKKPSLITSADSAAVSLSFSVSAHTTSVILVIAKPGRSEIRLRKTLNSAKIKINARWKSIIHQMAKNMLLDAVFAESKETTSREMRKIRYLNFEI
jgi:hypothetical protein